MVSDDSPAWHCPNCGRRFGHDWKSGGKVAQRTVDEWTKLIKAMLPKPVQVGEAGELQAGSPVAVIVRVEPTEIVITTAAIEWPGPHSPVRVGRPFAKVPLRTAASRVSELIARAWSKRVSEYRWCPRCEQTMEPERMTGPVCHSCATEHLGVVY
jgi:hypothetical protein